VSENQGLYGGGIYSGTSLTVTGSTLADNTRALRSAAAERSTSSGTGHGRRFYPVGQYGWHGGGNLCLRGRSDDHQRYLSGNDAGDGGGLLVHAGATAAVTGSTLSGNVGDGIDNETTQAVTLKNSIVAGNLSTGANPFELDLAGLFNSAGRNLFGTIGDNVTDTANDDIVLAGANRKNNGQPAGQDASISDVFATVANGAGALANNGGPVKTIALKPTGLAVDTGINADFPQARRRMRAARALAASWMPRRGPDRDRRPRVVRGAGGLRTVPRRGDDLVRPQRPRITFRR